MTRCSAACGWCGRCDDEPDLDDDLRSGFCLDCGHYFLERRDAPTTLCAVCRQRHQDAARERERQAVVR